MIYQLPNGRIIYITVDQFLGLSDDELDALSSQNIGEYARSPWVGSAIRKPQKREKEKEEDHEEHDSSIDYIAESDELGGERPSIGDELISEDLPDPPEDINND